MQNPKSKKKRKFRILLDSAFAKPDAFPKLKKKSNLAHVVHNLGLSLQAEDEEVYQKAIEENRFVLTINYKDFRRLVKSNRPGILATESELTNEEIDEKMSEFISGKDPMGYYGKAIKVP